SSCVLSQIFVSNHPSTPAGPNDDHSTSRSSKFTWPHVKHVSIVVVCLVLGSYISRPRWPWLVGKSLADAWSNPARHQAGVSGFRMRAAAQTRPCLSIEKLCTVVLLFQIASSPQYGDGAAGGVFTELGVSGSRTVSLIWLAVFLLGSITGR